ncbi:LysR substrate-binding domain-containing protein [Pseudooceanicola sp. 200-1SW]|uniref:LysR substrate-binding domain-containing protein n=1 Tax=Pseudooceanicola sp. 200-1SW TaxID=3425949 RepID=UPI003D7F3AB4
MTIDTAQWLDAERMRILRRVSLRQLLYFLQLTRDGSFRRAASNLAVSQPTLSQQIAKLEDALGTPLVERAANGFSLTPEGARMAELLLPLLRDLGGALTDIRPEDQARPIRLGIPSYQAYPQIDAFFAALRKAHPGLQVQRVEIAAREMCLLLRDKQLDAAFLSLPTPGEMPRPMEMLPFYASPYELCFHESHPMAARDYLRPEDVAEMELILLPRSHHPALYDSQMDGLRALGIEPKLSSSEVTNVSGQMSLAASTGAACIVCPATMQLPPGMVSRPTRPALPMLALSLFWHKQSYNPQLERMLNVMQKVISGWKKAPAPGR